MVWMPFRIALTRLCIWLIGDEDRVHEHVFGQVSLSLESAQKRMKLAALERRRDRCLQRLTLVAEPFCLRSGLYTCSSAAMFAAALNVEMSNLIARAAPTACLSSLTGYAVCTHTPHTFFSPSPYLSPALQPLVITRHPHQISPASS